MSGACVTRSTRQPGGGWGAVPSTDEAVAPATIANTAAIFICKTLWPAGSISPLAPCHQRSPLDSEAREGRLSSRSRRPVQRYRGLAFARHAGYARAWGGLVR